MRVISTIEGLHEALQPWREKFSVIGLVPTMGYLHEGHLALMRRARSECEVVVASVFVNPLQFGPGEDFDKYPRDIERDERLSRQVGADFMFTPSTGEMFPSAGGEVAVDVGRIAEIVEGRFRPGHFVGVATICTKLFNIVRPGRAYFGKKDAQQLAVMRKVVRELNLDVEIIGCETVREPGSLAMSSRNVYLDEPSRKAASVIWEGLAGAGDRFMQGERRATELRRAFLEHISSEPLVELQYVEVVDPVTFEPVPEVVGAAIIAVAALVGGTRLIDNIEVGG